MSTLRRLVADRGTRHLFRFSDDSVVDFAAELLVRDQLHIHAEVKALVQVHVGQAASAAPAVVRRPAPSPSRVSFADDPPTFPSEVDLEDQAAVLVAAAASGAPFCPL